MVDCVASKLKEMRLTRDLLDKCRADLHGVVYDTTLSYYLSKNDAKALGRAWSTIVKVENRLDARIGAESRKQRARKGSGT